MTEKEYNDKLARIKEQEEKLGVTISMVKPHDKDHLDCFWYGGEVGTIRFPESESTVVISACGDIDITAYIGGKEINFRDKANGGTAFGELGDILDDRKLITPDGEDCIFWNNNNWFEANVITPDGSFVDMSSADNIIEGDLLDCFSDVEEYLELIDKAEEMAAEREFVAQMELARQEGVLYE